MKTIQQNIWLFRIFLFFVFAQAVSAQNQVAITIDDVPNTKQYYTDGFESKLLMQLERLQIPVAIFINEGLLFKNDHVINNISLLNSWIEKGFITLGNHTFDHLRYSEVGHEVFKENVEKGAYLTAELAKKHDKTLKHFRFPFNDMGKDFLQNKSMDEYLSEQGYRITPFTIESSDWMFSAIYQYHKDKGELDQARKVGQEYVEKTLAYFDFFEKVAEKNHGGPLRHIYLCHDNALNADYLPELVNRLKARQYQFISLDDALEDQAYQQNAEYYKKWGISWLYRWMKDRKAMYKLMRSEPDISELQKKYDQLMAE